LGGGGGGGGGWGGGTWGRTQGWKKGRKLQSCDIRPGHRVTRGITKTEGDRSRCIRSSTWGGKNGSRGLCSHEGQDPTAETITKAH